MSIQIRWSAAFSSYTGAVDGELEAKHSDVVTPESISRAAGFTDEDISTVLPFVNGTRVPMDGPLKDGDEVRFDIDIHPG